MWIMIQRACCIVWHILHLHYCNLFTISYTETKITLSLNHYTPGIYFAPSSRDALTGLRYNPFCLGFSTILVFALTDRLQSVSNSFKKSSVHCPPARCGFIAVSIVSEESVFHVICLAYIQFACGGGLKYICVEWHQIKNPHISVRVLCRGTKIRTWDPLLPKQVR